MVLAMLRDLIPLLFLMVVSSMLLTRLMAMLAMLLMSPMMELLSTQMPLHLTMLPLSLPMLVNKKHKRKHNKDNSFDTDKSALHHFHKGLLQMDKTGFVYLYIFISYNKNEINNKTFIAETRLGL